MFSEIKVDIKKITVDEKGDEIICDIIVLVKNKDELEKIMKQIKNGKGILKVIRKN